MLLRTWIYLLIFYLIVLAIKERQREMRNCPPVMVGLSLLFSALSVLALQTFIALLFGSYILRTAMLSCWIGPFIIAIQCSLAFLK